MMANKELSLSLLSVKCNNNEARAGLGVSGHPEGRCVVCGLKTALKCHGCVKGRKDANDIPFYCGKEHQTSHWKSDHKAKCGNKSSDQGWKVVQTPWENNDLPYFEATKDLQLGHVLFTKKPLLVIPFIISNEEVQTIHSTSPERQKQLRSLTKRNLWTCLSCYELMSYGNVAVDPVHGLKMNKCLDCGWPIHSNIIPGQPPSSCQLLHANECSLLMKNGLKWETLVDSEGGHLYYYLGLVRAVLLRPELKKELLNLPVLRPELYSFIDDSDRMIDFVRHQCNLKDKVSESELKKMLLIIFSNSLGSGSYTGFRKMYNTSLEFKSVFKPTNVQCYKRKMSLFLSPSRHTLSIYRGGSTGRILPHDCRPNCDYYINVKTLEATFKTIREVKKGEKLSLNYFAPTSHFPIYDRMINKTEEFFMPPCRCARCFSLTEDGTYLSAIRCPGMTRSQVFDCQYLVPTLKPGTSKVYDMFLWRCIGCSYTTTQSTVKQLIDNISDEIERAAASNDYVGLKSIVEKYSGKVVHPKNSAMVLAYIKIANCALKCVNDLEPFRNGRFNFDLHTKYLHDFDKAIEIDEELQPGRCESKGYLLFCRALLKMSELSDKVKTPETVPSKEDLIKQLDTIQRNLKESWIIANDNPFRESTDKLSELTLQKLYANHLASSIKKAGDLADLPAVKSFCEKYTDGNVLQFWREWKNIPVNWTLISGNKLPKLLEEMKRDERFLEKLYAGTVRSELKHEVIKDCLMK